MVLDLTYNMNLNLPKDQLENLMEQTRNQFLYSETVGSLISKLDEYYSSYDNRKFVVYKVILLVTGKNWWNTKTGTNS
jgi:hypothetical protein